MRIDRDAPVGGPVVRALGPAGFLIGEKRYSAALMTAEWVQGWTPPPLAVLDADALAALLEPAPEFVLIGTGAALARPPAALTAALEARDIGVEAMDSRAAARAWGVLRGEGRRVAAALYPVDAQA